jgi:putative addiction module component (TIGR02574 family)
MTTFASVLQAAMKLTPRERTQLAETLWESIPTDEQDSVPLELSESWKQELAQRSSEIEAGTVQCVTYEQMVDRARRAAGHQE